MKSQTLTAIILGLGTLGNPVESSADEPKVQIVDTRISPIKGLENWASSRLYVKPHINQKGAKAAATLVEETAKAVIEYGPLLNSGYALFDEVPVKKYEVNYNSD